MPSETSRRRRRGRFVVAVALLLFAPACGGGGDEPTEVPKSPPPGKGLPKVAEEPKAAPAAPLKDEIPPDELDAVSTAHFRGLGLMEQDDGRKDRRRAGEQRIERDQAVVGKARTTGHGEELDAMRRKRRENQTESDRAYLRISSLGAPKLIRRPCSHREARR